MKTAWFISLRLLTVAILGFDASQVIAASDAYTNGVSSYIARAAGYGVIGNWDKMIAECDEAIRLNPDAVDAYRGRGAAYFQKENWNAVITNYSEVLRLDQNDKDAYSYLGYAYNRLGSYDKAIETYSKFLSLNPNAAAGYGGRAFAFGKKDEIDKAISDYDAAIKIDPKDAEAYFGRAYEYGYKRDFEKVIKDFSEAIRLKPTYKDAYFYRGYAYRTKGDLDKAADDYLKCLEIDPTDEMILSSLNSVAWQLATDPEASIRNGRKSLEAAKKACELSTWGNWQYLDTLAASYAETGDFNNAIKYQMMVTNLEPSVKIQEQYGLVQRLKLYEQKKPYREVAKPPLDHAMGSIGTGSQLSTNTSHATNNLPTQFRFITTNTTLQQIIDRLGRYDRVRGSGISYYEYDLPGGSAVLVGPEWPFQPTNKIGTVMFYHSTNQIDLYP